jgi:hypothetical protein
MLAEIGRTCQASRRITMKQILASLLGLTLLLAVVQAADQSGGNPSGHQYQYAIVKWDGPDRLYYNLPNKFELIYLKQKKVIIPKDAQEEEFCLAWAANDMAKDGWEPHNLDSRRILFRRVRK